MNVTSNPASTLDMLMTRKSWMNAPSNLTCSGTDFVMIIHPEDLA